MNRNPQAKRWQNEALSHCFETADVLAWLTTIANVAGVDLSEVVTQNWQRAIIWYRKAAKNGNVIVELAMHPHSGSPARSRVV